MADGRDESNIFFNKKDDDDGVIVRIWMGPVAPALANLQHPLIYLSTLANLLICQFANLLIHQSTCISPMTLSKTSTLVGKIHFVDNSNHFNTFTLSHVHHHTNYPRRAL